MGRIKKTVIKEEDGKVSFSCDFQKLNPSTEELNRVLAENEINCQVEIKDNQRNERYQIVFSKVSALVSLVFTSFGTEFIRGVPDGVSVDLKKGTWCFEGKNYKIGDTMPYGRRNRYRGSVVGVYDITNIEHAKSMHMDAEKVRDTRDTGD